MEIGGVTGVVKIRKLPKTTTRSLLYRAWQCHCHVPCPTVPLCHVPCLAVLLCHVPCLVVSLCHVPCLSVLMPPQCAVVCRADVPRPPLLQHPAGGGPARPLQRAEGLLAARPPSRVLPGSQLHRRRSPPARRYRVHPFTLPPASSCSQ